MKFSYQIIVMLIAMSSIGGNPTAADAQVPPTTNISVPTTLTLDQAIAIALAHQPQRYIALAQVSAAQGQKQQAQAEYAPTITPAYQFQNNTSDRIGVATSTSAVNGPSPVDLVRGGGLSIALDQNIYDGGQREAANAEARHNLQAAEFGASNASQEIVQTVSVDYYQVLQDIDLVKVAQSAITNNQQLLDQTNAQIAVGTVAPKDAFQAQANLANAQVSLEQSQIAQGTDEAALKNAMGIETDASLTLAAVATAPSPPTPSLTPTTNGATATNGLIPTTPTPALPALPTDAGSATLDTLISQAYANRPDLNQQGSAVQSSLSALREAKMKAGFTVSSDFVATYQATNDIGARGLDSALIVTGSYPLFDGGASRGAVRTAQAQLDAAKDQADVIRQGIRLDVDQAYQRRTLFLTTAKLAQTAVTAAQVNYDAAIASEKAGVSTIVDVTTAQTTLTQAQSQYVSAVYSYYGAAANLQRAIGQNLPGVTSSSQSPATNPVVK